MANTVQHGVYHAVACPCGNSSCAGHSVAAGGYSLSAAPDYPLRRYPPKWINEITGMLSDHGILAMRLGHHTQLELSYTNGELGISGFEYLGVHRVSPHKVLVFVVANEQATVLEDDGLFPSDTLITQLRLLEKK